MKASSADRFAPLSPYLAEIGRAVFYSSLAIAGAAASLEYFAPGVVGNYVATQHLAAAAALGMALTLLEPRVQPAKPHRLIRLTLAIAAAAAAYAAVFRYMASAPEVQEQAAFAAAGAVVAALLTL